MSPNCIRSPSFCFGIVAASLAGVGLFAAGLLADDFDLYEIHKKAIAAKDKSSKESNSKERTAKDLKTKESKNKESKNKVIVRSTALEPIGIPSSNAALSQILLRLHNEYRAQNGVPPLELHPKLTAAAQRYAESSFLKRRFGHRIDGKTPAERIDAEGLEHGSWAENMALGQQSPYAAMSGWVRSTGHRKNILSPHTHVGFGNVGGVWVAVFANPNEEDNEKEDKVKEDKEKSDIARK